MRACRRLIDTSFCEMPCELQKFEATHASRVRETLQSLDVLTQCGLSIVSVAARKADALVLLSLYRFVFPCPK